MYCYFRSSFEQNALTDQWMLVFDLNSLVTVLIARKLGSICNVTNTDLNMEDNLPNIMNDTAILDSELFKRDMVKLTIDDSEFLFSEMSENISNILCITDADNRALNEALDEVNGAISDIICDSIDVEETKEAMKSKFKDNRISYQICIFIKENLLSVEGLKVEKTSTLVLFSIIWKALSNHVPMSTDECDQQFLVTMKHFGSLYELLRDKDCAGNTNEAPNSSISPEAGCGNNLARKYSETILSRALFLWLGLHVEDFESSNNKNVRSGALTTNVLRMTEEIFAFLSIPTDVCLLYLSNAFKHQQQRISEIGEVLPIAIHVLKEVKRHVALVSKLPLVIALIADELYCQSVLGIMGIQPDLASWDNVQLEDEAKPSFGKLVHRSNRGISSLIRHARKPLRLGLVQCLVDLRNGQRVFKGGNSVVTVLIALSLEFWKCDEMEFNDLMTSSENVASPFLASATHLLSMNSNIYIKTGIERLLVILTLLLRHGFSVNSASSHSLHMTAQLEKLYRGLSTITTTMLERVKKLALTDEYLNATMRIGSKKNMSVSCKMEEVMQFIAYFRLVTVDLSSHKGKEFRKSIGNKLIAPPCVSLEEADKINSSSFKFPFVGETFETNSMRLAWIKMLMSIEKWSVARDNVVLRIGAWNSVKSICLSIPNNGGSDNECAINSEGELIRKRRGSVDARPSTSNPGTTPNQVSLRKYLINLMFERMNDAQWDDDKIEENPDFHPSSMDGVNDLAKLIEVEFNLAKSMYCNIGDTRSTLLHGSGGKGYCLANKGITSGCVQWTFDILKETKGNEGTCVGVSLANVKDYSHRTTKDMWLYRAYSGNLYHNGEVPSALPEFTEGDSITVQLDMDEGTISFAKNGGPLRLAFTDIPTNKIHFGPKNDDLVELYPVVVFYSLNPGEKVRIKNMKENRRSKVLGCGEFNGNCSPVNETISQHIVNLVQEIYISSVKEEHQVYRCSENDYDSDDSNIYNDNKRRAESWKRCIQSILMERLTSQETQKCVQEVQTQCKGESENDTGSADSVNGRNNDASRINISIEKAVLPKLNKTLKLIWPALAVISNIDSGLKVGSKVKRIVVDGGIPSGKNHTGYIIGAPSDDSLGINVAWEPSNSTTVVPFSKIEDCRCSRSDLTNSFANSNSYDILLDIQQDLLSYDSLKMFLSLSKITEMISVAFNFQHDWRKALNKTHILNNIEHKQPTLLNPIVNIEVTESDNREFHEPGNASNRDTGRDKRSSSLPDTRTLDDVSSSVESLTNSLVTSIMDEVTGKKILPCSTTAKLSQTSPLLKTSLISNFRGRSPKPGVKKFEASTALVEGDGIDRQKNDFSSDSSENVQELLNHNVIEDLMVKASFLEFIALKTLFKLASSPDATYLLQLATEESMLTQEQKYTVEGLRIVFEFCTGRMNTARLSAPLDKRVVESFELERSLSMLHSNYSKRINRPSSGKNVVRVDCPACSSETTCSFHSVGSSKRSRNSNRPELPRPSPRTSMPFARAAVTSLFDTQTTPSFSAQLTAATAAAIEAIDTREPEMERDDDTLEMFNITRRSDAPATEGRPSTTGSTPAPTSIHVPLREMGFQDEHISESLAILNLDGSDTSAQRINQCAGWMIDHPWTTASASSDTPRTSGKISFINTIGYLV